MHCPDWEISASLEMNKSASHLILNIKKSDLFHSKLQAKMASHIFLSKILSLKEKKRCMSFLLDAIPLTRNVLLRRVYVTCFACTCSQTVMHSHFAKTPSLSKYVSKYCA